MQTLVTTLHIFSKPKMPGRELMEHPNSRNMPIFIATMAMSDIFLLLAGPGLRAMQTASTEHAMQQLTT